MVIDQCVCQIWYASVKSKISYGPDKKTCQKPYRFDLDVKGQHRIGIMNVRDTSSHSDTPMYQIWYANVKPRKSYGLYMNLHRQMDRHSTDKMIPIYPNELCLQGV